VVLAFLAVVLPLAVWISGNRRVMAALWNNFALIAAVLVFQTNRRCLDRDAAP